ncbi:MAG: HAD-IIIC family phosphatase [Terriglobia bacterium]
MECAALRSEIDRAIAAGDAAAAFSSLAELWSRDPSSSTAGFVISRYEALRGRLALKPYRLAILRSFTVEPIVPFVRAGAFTYGIDLSVHRGDFNAYTQEILDPKSAIYAFQPDAVFLAVATCDIAPDLWSDYARLSPDAAANAATRVIQNFADCIGAFRQHSNASLVIHTLEQPAFAARGIIDAQAQRGQARLIESINNELRCLAAKEKGVYVLDYDALVAHHGRQAWRDERKWLTARLPVAAPHLGHVAREWLRFLLPLAGKVAKAVALDLDNTLWGGVIGEDGLGAIQVGPEYPGAAYQAIQRALLDLSQRGVLLAVCSKNNPEEALEALEKHPGMLLRPKHFASLRINWNDKPQNLREIAAELNIGVDAIAFVDDNAAERRQVRAMLPDVGVVELPADPMGFAAALRDCPLFERLALSEEDRHRSSYYAAERERKQLEQKVQTKEQFYRSLAQEAEIAPVERATLTRIAQLTQKTNQFNLTTRRYTEQQIAQLAETPGWAVWSIRVRDRFGDNGLVGVAITQDAGEACEIDTFLLSCRVIGRTVETALLARLVEKARQRGIRRVQGWFLPTKKNAPARDFYGGHGFRLARQNGEGLLWELDLSRESVAAPEWIAVSELEGGTL